MFGTRNDIAYAVGAVSRRPENPTEPDVIRIKRIFGYLRNTTDCGVYKNNVNDVWRCYLKSWGSTSRVLCSYSGAPID